MKDFYNTLQTTIKKHIIDNYGNYLSNDMKNLLMEKNYINDLTLKISNLNEVFNHLVYKMLCDLLDKHYYTKYNIDENDEIYVPCAERFKEALVNYYIIDLSKKVKYSPIIDKSLAYEIDYIKNLNTLFDNVIDKNVFSKNIKELQEIDELYDFILKCNEYDIKLYLKSNE